MRLTRTDLSDNELFPTQAWRLLLPDPVPALTVALGGGPVSEVARRVLDAVDGTGGDNADLAVADDVEPPTLRALRRRLGPGGVAYVEAPAAVLRGATPVEKAFRDAGFDAIQLYALSPGPGRWKTSWWVPVDTPDAIRFLAGDRLTGRVPPRSVKVRAANTVNRLAGAVPAAFAARPWLLHPTRGPVLCAVAVVADGNGRSDTTPGLARAAAQAVGRRGLAPKAMMRAGGGSTDQPMLLVFDRTSQPVAVVKAPVLSEEIEAADREAEILASLHRRSPPVSGVPIPLAMPPHDRMFLTGQTFIGGDPVADLVHPHTFSEFGGIATTWTIELGKATAEPVPPGTHTRHLNALLAELRDTIGADVADRVAAAVGPDLESIRFGVTQHRDLGPWNVHRHTTGHIGVVDWADAVRCGPPLSDLAYHLVHLALCAHDAYGQERRTTIIDQTVDRSHHLGRVIATLENDYAQAVGVPLAAVPSLRLFTWLHTIGFQEPEHRAGGLHLEILKAELAAR